MVNVNVILIIILTEWSTVAASTNLLLVEIPYCSCSGCFDIVDGYHRVYWGTYRRSSSYCYRIHVRVLYCTEFYTYSTLEYSTVHGSNTVEVHV